jgi:hypothetical protein
MIRCFAVRAAAQFSSRRGAQAEWEYEKTKEFETALRDVLLTLSDCENKGSSIQEFQKRAFAIYGRSYSPFTFCERICEAPLCLYRYPAADFLANEATKDIRQTIRPLLSLDAAPADFGKQIWNQVEKAGFELVAIAGEATEQEKVSTRESSIRASLCFVQQLVSQTPRVHPRDAEVLLESVLKSAKGKG